MSPLLSATVVRNCVLWDGHVHPRALTVVFRARMEDEKLHGQSLSGLDSRAFSTAAKTFVWTAEALPYWSKIHAWFGLFLCPEQLGTSGDGNGCHDCKHFWCLREAQKCQMTKEAWLKLYLQSGEKCQGQLGRWQGVRRSFKISSKARRGMAYWDTEAWLGVY